MGRLDLSNVAVVDDEQLEEEYDYAVSIIEEAKSIILSYGVDPMPQPSSAPEPLAEIDIERLENRQLGALYTRYVAYQVFLGGRLAEIECAEKAAKSYLIDTKAAIENELRAKGKKGTEIQALVVTHPLYRKALVEHEKQYFIKKIVKAYHDGYAEQAKALSRNVTIRELEFDQSKREHNVGRSKGRTPKRQGFTKPRKAAGGGGFRDG